MELAKRVQKKKQADGPPPRLKLLLFGATGVGKTTSSIWPDSYFIDTERGTDHYGKLLADRNCAVVQTTDLLEASTHLERLADGDHDFKTTVVDPVTAFYDDSQNRWTDRYTAFHTAKEEDMKASMQDFGPSFWGKVKREQKQFIALLKRLDMNVIVTAHEKDKYAPGQGLQIIGQTYDGLKGLDYLFDVVLRLTLRGDKRVALTLKDRTHKFPESFEYKYDTILELWGEGLTRKAATVPMATPEQVTEVEALLKTIKVGDDWVSSVFRKAEVDAWGELDQDQIGKCITLLRKRLPKESTEGGAK